VRLKRRGLKLLALFLGLSLVAAACGSDSKSSSGTDGKTSTTEGAAGIAGGDFTDLATIVGSPLEHIDPALNSTLDGYNVSGNPMFDGLTAIDATDAANPKIVPDVAESVKANADASVWTFKIRKGEIFASGEAITPTTFQKSWERAADLAGDYSYLLSFIDGGAERLAGTAPTISGIKADDATMTLTVTLDAPYSNFDAVAGFQLFMPVPKEAIAAGKDWENQVMFGNGPYKEAAARNDQEIKLVKNDKYDGDFNGNKWPDRLDSITFRVAADPDTSFNSFEAGEADNGQVPPARVADIKANDAYGSSLGVSILGSYHYVFNQNAPEIGGDKNLKLRQAISKAINRDEINDAVYNGSRQVSTGITPPGIPGFKKDICKYCDYDPKGAQKLFDEWKAAGNKQAAPLKIQFNADAGHEPVVAIVVDNLKVIGIQAVADPKDGETYFSDLAKGACIMCRAGWFADYPTYDNFMSDLFHSVVDKSGKKGIGGNNFGFVNDKFDALVDEGKKTVDKAAQAKLFQQSEELLLNEQTMAVPINWYRGDYVWSKDRVASFTQDNFGFIHWEQIKLAK
jgi:oligopeptide transport system substrate-binding protein